MNYILADNLIEDIMSLKEPGVDTISINDVLQKISINTIETIDVPENGAVIFKFNSWTSIDQVQELWDELSDSFKDKNILGVSVPDAGLKITASDRQSMISDLEKIIADLKGEASEQAKNEIASYREEMWHKIINTEDDICIEVKTRHIMEFLDDLSTHDSSVRWRSHKKPTEHTVWKVWSKYDRIYFTIETKGPYRYLSWGVVADDCAIVDYVPAEDGVSSNGR
jgi:hypothetical protein